MKQNLSPKVLVRVPISLPHAEQPPHGMWTPSTPLAAYLNHGRKARPSTTQAGMQGILLGWPLTSLHSWKNKQPLS